MTYDKLLEKIERERKFLQEYIDGEDFTVLHALRAVVELHKPHNEYSNYCAGCEVDDPWYWNEYPCRTIQAIEKELQ